MKRNTKASKIVAAGPTQNPLPRLRSSVSAHVCCLATHHTGAARKTRAF